MIDESTADGDAIDGSGGGMTVDYNKVAFIPFAADRLRFGAEIISIKAGSYQMERLEISQITVTVDDVANVPPTAAVIQGLLDQFHPRKDVTVFVPLDLLEKAEKTQRLFTVVLGSIAGISLLVGGVGITNIMLASVVERTKEIGVRRALGAKRRDIAAQFLVETLVLTCGGGVLGVTAGIGLSKAVTSVFGYPMLIPAWSPVMAFGVALAIGLIFGTYPARRAAFLDPIEALRHE